MNSTRRKIFNLIALLAMLASCTNEPPEAPAAPSPASLTLVTLAQNTPAARAPVPGHPLTDPADVTTLTLTHHQGAAPVTTYLKYEGGAWVTHPGGQPTFLINTVGTTLITATHRPEIDVVKSEPQISRYADLLQATADLGSGITVGTPAGGEIPCQITFNMRHTRALLEQVTVKNDLGHTLALADDPNIEYHITDAQGEPRWLTTPIAPAGARLTGITLTLMGGDRLTATGNILLEGGKKYTPQLTLAQNTLTLHIPEGPSGIADWNKDFEVTQPHTRTVASEEELIALREEIEADAPNFGRGFIVLQTANIVLTGEWTSIYRFDGTYNGAGYTITGLRGQGGLFDSLGGQVANVHLKGVNIDGSDGSNSNAGALANFAYGASIACCSATGTVKAGDNAGGLIGLASGNAQISTTITRSRATCDVTSTNGHAGGLIGCLEHSTLVAAGATGNVSGPSIAGGLTGYAQSSHIFACYATGNVSDATTNGGLVGHLNSGSIQCSYTISNNLIGGHNNPPFVANWPDETGSKQGEESPWLVVYSPSANPIHGIPTWTGTSFEPRNFLNTRIWTFDPFPLINYNYAGY